MSEFKMKGQESKKWNPVEVPENLYAARISRLEKTSITDAKTKEERNCIEVMWEIVEGDHKGKELSYLCTALLTEKSKLGELVNKLTGTKITKDTDYDLGELLVGKIAKVFAEKKSKVDQDGKPFNYSVVNKIVKEGD